MVRIPKGSVFIHIQELNISLNYLGKVAFSLMLNISHVAVCMQPVRTGLVGIFVAFFNFHRVIFAFSLQLVRITLSSLSSD